MICPIRKIWKKKPCLKQQNGAATVEFAFAMIALFAFFAIFMQFVLIFIAHEQTIFGGFAAARTHAVKGTGAAISTAGAIDGKASVEFTSGGLLISRDIPVPSGIDRVFSQGQGHFTVTHRSPTFREPDFNDDNPVPF
jgi:hypothetical protein